MYGVDWGEKKKKETVDLHRNYLFTICAHITTDKQIKSNRKLCTKKSHPIFMLTKIMCSPNAKLRILPRYLKLSTIIMKCLLFPPFSIIVLLLNGGHNGANNNCICNSKDPRYQETF